MGTSYYLLLLKAGLTCVLLSSPTSGSPPPLPKPVSVQKLTLAQLPDALKPTGKLLEAWRWMDSLGENTLVAYRTVSLTKNQKLLKVHPELRRKLADPLTIRDIEDDMRTAQLFVRQYVRHEARYEELWRLQDAVQNCPVDMSLGLLPGAISVTDLDADGQTETTLAYSYNCHGDVSSSTLKLVMHEGKAKYALRGYTVQMLNYSSDQAGLRRKLAGPICCLDQLSEKSPHYYSDREGRYQNEKDFTAAPPTFLIFARQLWRKWRTHENSVQL